MLQIFAKRLAVFVRNEHDRVAYLVHDAHLDLGLRVNRFDGFRKSLEAVDADHKDIVDAAILHFIQNAHPEFCRLAFADPDSDDFFHSVLVNAQRDVGNFGCDLATITNLEVQAVEVHNGIAGGERPRQPLFDKRKYLVCYRRHTGLR